jgi:hypothetical protein
VRFDDNKLIIVAFVKTELETDRLVEMVLLEVKFTEKRFVENKLFVVILDESILDIVDLEEERLPVVNDTEFIDPLTSSVYPGDVVFIPTLPVV